MKLTSALLAFSLGVAALAWSGCESVADATGAVRERLAARDEPKIRRYAAPPRATYDALRTAATQMGYRFTRGGPAQGEFEAVSDVRAGETHGSSRQISMKVKLRATLDGAGTELSVRLGEIIENDSSNRAGLATEAPLRDTPQYEVLFERVGQVLGVPAQNEKSR